MPGLWPAGCHRCRPVSAAVEPAAPSMTEALMPLPRRLLAGLILAIMALLVALALAACGGGTTGDGIASANGGAASPSPSASAAASLTDAQRARRFAQCMRD